MHGTDPMALARQKADLAFELFRLLDVPFFCFHDRDVAPEGETLRQSNANLHAIADLFSDKMATTKVRLLWGTANLFSHPRYMAGAATNPDPDVFAGFTIGFGWKSFKPNIVATSGFKSEGISGSVATAKCVSPRMA